MSIVLPKYNDSYHQKSPIVDIASVLGIVNIDDISDDSSDNISSDDSLDVELESVSSDEEASTIITPIKTTPQLMKPMLISDTLEDIKKIGWVSSVSSSSIVENTFADKAAAIFRFICW